MNVCSICKNRGISYFIVLPRYCVCGFLFVLHKLKVCGNLVLSKSTGTIFPIAFAHFMCHVLWEFAQYFKLFSYYYHLCYDVLWSVILDVTTVLFWGITNHTHTRQWTWLINVCVLTAPSTHCPRVSSPRTSDSLRHNNNEMRPINNPTVASKGSSERKSHTFLPLSQKTRND